MSLYESVKFDGSIKVPNDALNNSLKIGVAIRTYPVPHAFPSGAAPSFTPVAVCPLVVIGKVLHLTTHLLVQACQHFWLAWYDDA